MAISSVTGSSVWINQQSSLNHQPSQISGRVQETGGDEDQSKRVHHRHHGGMGQALMQTLKQLVQAMPADLSSQNATGNHPDSDQNGLGSQASSVRSDMHSFMYALFQAIRSPEQPSPSSTSSYSTDFDGSKFESGLSSLISQLASGSGSGNRQISDLQNAFNTLVQNLQNGQPDGSNLEQTQDVNLQSFLASLQQNLLISQQPISATGNVLNAQG
jgi:hypothetical protein